MERASGGAGRPGGAAGGPLEVFLPVIYEELRRLAARHMRRERSSHTLQPTALVHELYLRLAAEAPLQWQNRAHFFGIAATSMRRILVEHARRRSARKRGGAGRGAEPPAVLAAVPLPDDLAAGQEELDVLALDEALTDLAQTDPERSRIVELRFFGGLTVEETAEVLGVSEATIARRWRLARAWLLRRLKPGAPGD
jgi:RNA polymerase sigma factor (TIGR02999 family)